MFFVFVALLIITILLVVADWRTESTRWGAGIAFAGCLGGFAESILDTFKPFLIRYDLLTTSLDAILDKAFNISYFGTHIAGPYAYFIFAICYYGIFNQKTRSLLKLLLIIPVIFMLVITPFNPIININFKIVSVWVIPYIFTGSYLLVKNYAKETNWQYKRTKLFVVFAAAVPVTFTVFSNYLARSFGLNDAFRYNTIVIALQFIFIIIIIVKYNFMGIRLKLEKQRLDSTMKAVFSGTSILNHAIKNEMLKIKMSADNFKNNIEIPQEKKNAENILKSTDYLLNMVSRIQNDLKEIELKKEDILLKRIIEQVLIINGTLAEEKNIILNTTLQRGDIVYNLDSIHVTEVINNIVKNSIEAMPEGGLIKISILDTKRKVIISITDNGPGIPKENLPYVKDPFFTTKKRTLNFGLGLSYCYNVMQKHKGDLTIQSEKDKGTTVLLSFPKSLSLLKLLNFTS